MHDPDVHFKRITAATVLDVCKLSHTLSDEQREMVADNAVSLAQAAYSDGAWVRAIYADSDLVGFIMLHLGSDYDDGIDCPGVFLWRLMIAGPGGVLPATWVRTHWGLLRVPARIRSKAGRVSSEDDKPFAAPNK